MQYRRLGNSGIMASVLGLGTWQTVSPATDANAYAKLVREAFDLGINCFDTADSYADGLAETMLGQALKSLPRSDYVVSTKCFFPRSGSPTNRGLSRKHIVESVNASLKRLQLDYLDLMLCHRFDEHTPVAETVSAMEDLIHQGKILYWGVCRWNPEQLQQAIDLSSPGYAPVMVQSIYNILHRNEEPVITFCSKRHTGFVAYSPLAQGILTGKYQEGIPAGSRAADEKRRDGMYDLTEKHIRQVARYQRIARDIGVPLPALALAWCLHTPGVTSALCGASSITQLRENVQGAELALDAGVLYKMQQAADA